MTLRFAFRQSIIEVLNATASRFDAADNQQMDTRIYRLDDEASYVPSSYHEVRVQNGTRATITCLLATTGGGTGIHDHSAFIHNNSLILAIGPFVVALHLPSLELNWKCQSDDATCFGIYHVIPFQCYISHGELAIARVSYRGTIDWSQGGADIFTGACSILNDCVNVVDWNNQHYSWDINTGNPVLLITG